MFHNPAKARCFCLCILICAFFSTGLYAQDASSPQSLPELDAALQQTALQAAGRIGSLPQGTKLRLGLFPMEEAISPLGSYWREQLALVLAGNTNRPYTIVEGGTAAVDYTLSGEIIYLGTTVRVYTKLIRSADSALDRAWTTDLPVNDFIESLLETSSSSSSNVRRDTYEPDSMDSPLAVETGAAWVSRTIHNDNDKDFFSITVQSAGNLVAETDGNIDTYMVLYDGDTHEELESDDDDGDSTNARIEYPVDAGKTYIAEVRGYGGDTGSYRFHALMEDAPSDSYEPNDTREQASRIEIGQTIEAYLSSRDADWFALDVPDTGNLLEIYTGGDVDTLLSVYDQAGNLLDDDDDSGSGGNAKVAVKAAPGTVYIEVTAYSGSRGSYTLHSRLKESIGPDSYEPDNSRDQAKPIVIGESQRRTFTDEDDEDWVIFPLRQGGRFTIRARGEDGSNLDTYLELFDSKENLIDENDDGGDDLDAYLSVRLDSGDYYIKVTTLDSDPDDFYILSVEAE